MILEPSTRVAVLALVAVLLLAGCTGGSGDGGAAATTTTTANDGVSTETTTTTADDGASGETTTAAGDGATTSGDGAGGATTTTAAPTTTSSDSGGAGGATFPATEAETALRNAGTYTLDYEFAIGTETMSGVQRIDVETGEAFVTMKPVGDDEVTYEYYVPPGSETAYQRFADQVTEVPVEYVGKIELAAADDDPETVEFPAQLRRAGSASGPLGPATLYVAEGVELVDESTRENYDVVSARMEVYVDDATGVISKYVYVAEFTDSETTTVTFEITDLGSPVQKPDWAP